VRPLDADMLEHRLDVVGRARLRVGGG
jgi:hypothetical protein